MMRTIGQQFPAAQNPFCAPGVACDEPPTNLSDFNTLVLAHQDAAYNMASYILSDPDLAEDVTQKAFLNAFLRLSTFRGGSFRNWLLAIVKNAAYDEIRRLRRHPSYSLETYENAFETAPQLSEPAPLPEQALEHKERRAALFSAISGLNTDQRAAVVLVDLQGLDYQDAAQILGVPVGTLKSRLARARHQLTEQPALRHFAAQIQ